MFPPTRYVLARSISRYSFSKLAFSRVTQVHLMHVSPTRYVLARSISRYSFSKLAFSRVTQVHLMHVSPHTVRARLLARSITKCNKRCFLLGNNHLSLRVVMCVFMNNSSLSLSLFYLQSHPILNCIPVIEFPFSLVC
uniref:Uncharacterized protein n=1 Tax=Cacopsylla melanoneura TaxID=428564 RepID=A0A8D8QEK6_9HEMI